MISIILPEYVEKAIETLRAHGHRAYAVGGCVRDSLRGCLPCDWDICTSARPEEMKTAFSKYNVIETGIKHGTLTILFDKTPVEITTFRVDGEYLDNRRPENVTFTDSLELDLSRRDFTVNAMAYAPGEGVIDPFGGQSDLSDGVIRCVGDADTRFNEDALRILRALRFSSVMSFEIENNTAKAIKKNAGLLKNIASERIRNEFIKLICGNDAMRILSDFRDVIAVFIPEIAATFDFHQRTKYHIYDVWQHTLHAINSIDPDPLLRLVMLFHDSGKPSCFTQDLDGAGHFYGHPAVSCEITNAIMHRLRFDNRTINDVCNLVKYHDSDVFCTEKSINRWLNKLGEENFVRLLKIKRADNLAQNPKYLRTDKLNRIEALYRDMLSRPVCFSLKQLAVNGNDLIKCGIPAGAEIGETLNQLLNEVMEKRLNNDRDTLLNYVRQKKNI